MWGRILGTLFGFMFGKIVGALLGFYVGYLIDRGLKKDFDNVGGFNGFFGKRSRVDRQAVFFHATFSVMGHIAKSNGRITDDHIRVAELLMNEMQLNGQQKKEAQSAYREGKESTFPLKETLQEFRKSVFNRRDILQVFLELQIQASYSDGILQSNEKELLKIVGKEFGFSQREVENLLQRWEAQFRFHQRNSSGGAAAAPDKKQLSDAYHLLGVKKESTDKDIKKAYRRLMQQHHPDKLISKGLPPEMMEMAKQKAQDIQSAYDMVMKTRSA